MARARSRARARGSRARRGGSSLGSRRSGGGSVKVTVIEPLPRHRFLGPTEFHPLCLTTKNVYFCHFCLENHFVAAANKTMMITLQCGHVACIGELQKYVKLYLSRNVAMIPCICTINNPSERESSLAKRKVCNKLLTHADLIVILGHLRSPLKDEDSATLFESMRKKLSNPTPRPCPNCQTPHIANPADPMMRCSHCNTVFCFTHGSAHGAKTCAEAYFHALFQDYSEKALNSQLAKPCTNKECRTPTLKSESNFMTCIKCNQNWCWRCQKSLEEDTASERHFRILSLFSPCSTRLIEDPRRSKWYWMMNLGIFHFFYFILAYLPAFALVLTFFLGLFFICIPVGMTSRRGCWRFFNTQVYYVSLGIGGLLSIYLMYPIFIVGSIFFGLSICIVKAGGFQNNEGGDHNNSPDIPYLEDVKSQRALDVVLTSSYGPENMGVGPLGSFSTVQGPIPSQPIAMNAMQMMYPNMAIVGGVPVANAGANAAGTAQMPAHPIMYYQYPQPVDGQVVPGPPNLQQAYNYGPEGTIVGTNPIYPAHAMAAGSQPQPMYGPPAGAVMYPPQAQPQQASASPHPPSTFSYDDVKKSGATAAVAPDPGASTVRAYNPVFTPNKDPEIVDTDSDQEYD